MIKVLVLNYEYPPLGGGAANATYYLLREFIKYSELQITLVTASVGEYRIEQPADNITIHFLDIGKRSSLHYQRNRDLLTYTWKAYRFSRRLARQQPFDLAHAFFGVPCGLIALWLGLPTIVSLRGSDVPFYNPRFFWQDRLLFKHLHGIIWRKAARVIANSQGLKKLANRSFPDQPIGVIPNGVDVHEFSPQKDKRPEPVLQLISTGRLIPRKGYDLLIRALEGMEGVALTLIGEGPQAEALQQQAQSIGVTLHLLGRVIHQDLPQHLQQADIFVLPSRNEGMSNAALEAMACGLPLILTETGGARELVRGNGVVVPKEDVSALRDAIMQYKQDPNLTLKEGLISRQIAESMSWEAVVEAYIRKYHQVIHG